MTATAALLAQKSERFATLRPLPPIDGDAPELPRGALPGELGDFVFDVAERTSGPPEFAAVAILCAVGAAIGTRAGVFLKAHDPWVEFPNLWGALIGISGVGKTPILSQALAPLRFADGDRRRAWEAAELPRLRRRDAAADIALARFTGKGARAADPEALAEARAEKETADRLLRAGAPRLTTSDPTPEKLAELLIANPTGILTERDELSGWLAELDREGRQGARAFYLEGWNARGGFDIDRIGRGCLHIPRVALSVLGGIQPGPLRRYVQEADGGGSGADGLLQRFQLVAWPPARPFHHVDRPPDHRAGAAMAALFSALLSVELPARLGAKEHASEMIGLRLSPEAQDWFSGWHTGAMNADHTEPCAPFGAWLAKVPKLLAGVALALFAVDVVAGRAEAGAIPLHTLKLAACLCDFSAEHAARMFGAARRLEVAAAHALLAQIRAGEIEDGETARDLARRQWRGLATQASVTAALSTLAEHGYVAVASVSTGGRPSRIVRLNPALLAEASA